MSSRTQASLGRTLMPAVALTTAAAGLVALLDHPSSGLASSAAPADTSSAAVVSGSVAVQAGTQPPAVSSTIAVAQPVAAETTPAVAAQQPAATAERSAATVAPTTARGTAAAGCSGKQIDGKTVNTRWGPVQVEAVVSSTHQICSVKAIQSPNSHGKSVRINNAALPILHKQVMSAQSANINGVSGATITSGGYERSLQSILDSLGG